MIDALHVQLAAALRRAEPYLDLLPDTAAVQVREAIAAFDLAVAQTSIVQTPGQPQCNHESYARVDGKCGGCGAP